MEVNSAKIAKATIWYTISNIILRGISLFTAPIFTRLLSTTDYGIAGNFVSWCSIVSCFTELGLSTAILRGKIDFRKEYKFFLSSIQTLEIIWSTFFSLIIFLSIDFWVKFMIMDKICIVVMLIYLTFYPAVTNIQIDYRFDYKYKQIVAISVLNTIGTVGCSLGLIFYWKNQRYLGRIMGMVLPSVILGLIFAIKILREGKNRVNIEYWRYALKLSLPMIPHGLAMIVLGQIDRIMIVKFCGESKAGIYTFGYSYAILISIITNAISDAVKPQQYEMLENRKIKQLAEFSYKLIFLGVLLSVVLIGVAPEALRILGTEEYYDSRWVIFPVAIGTIMQYMYQFFGTVEIYCRKTYFMALGSIGAAFLNYYLNLWLIPQYGYIAAAYTTLISYIILMYFHYFASRFSYKNEIYNFLIVSSISIVAVGVGFGLNMLYNTTFLLRYTVLIIVIIVTSYVLRDTIKSVMSQFRKSKKV
jgi:polysaccharide biosynthesis protein